MLLTSGYWHEQSRSDRDDFVEIKWNNIIDDYKYAFDKHVSADLQDLPYDIGSIMQYHAYYFAKNKSLPTIVPKNGAGLDELGQLNGFSDSDMIGINNLYCGMLFYHIKL